MATFAIRAVHDSQHGDIGRIADSLTHAGAYFLKHASWGCSKGDHSAWLEVEADCEDEVRLMVPPVLRTRATVVLLSGETREVTS